MRYLIAQVVSLMYLTIMMKDPNSIVGVTTLFWPIGSHVECQLTYDLQKGASDLDMVC